jgi:hypothetical protein
VFSSASYQFHFLNYAQYSPLSGAAAAMKEQNVTRVLLGASSLLSNGAMLGPAGQ